MSLKPISPWGPILRGYEYLLIDREFFLKYLCFYFVSSYGTEFPEDTENIGII